MICPFCSNTSLTKLNTYKHYWYYCNDCGNAHAEAKKKILIQWLPRFLLNWKPGFKIYIKNEEILKDKSKIFDYMCGPKRIEADNKRKLYEKAVDFFSRHGLNFHGKKVLDISGGSGHFIKRLSEEFNCEVAFTEYSMPPVRYAKEKLHLNAKRYDFNKDKIKPLFPNTKFDFILLRSNIMFMEDIDGLIKDFHSITKKGTILVVIDSVMPTPHVFLRWQFDDYIMFRYHNPETVIRIFAENNYELVARDKRPDRKRITPLHLKPLNLLYDIPSRFKKMNQEKVQKGCDLIFRRL